MRTLFVWASAALLLSPYALAQNGSEIDVETRETEEGAVQESTGDAAVGIEATSLVVLLVVGVILVAFVATVARRRR